MRAKGFISNKQGNVTVLFAVLLPVLLIVVGGVIDYGAALNVRTQAQSASDAASIAGVKFGYDFPQRKEMAARYFLANYPEAKWGVEYGVDDLSIQEKDGGVKISTPADKSYNSIILSLAGINKLNVNTISEFTAGAGADYDIVLVIDRSKSMRAHDASVGKSRINAVVDTSEEFIRKVTSVANPNARVSVAFFYGGKWKWSSGRSFIAKRLSNDIAYFNDIPRSADGGTCGACGLSEANKILSAQEPSHTARGDNRTISKNKIIIVLSDGEFNKGNATAEANLIKNKWPDVQIYSIFLGGGSNEARTIATTGADGQPLYFPTTNAAEMQKVFRQISSQLSMLRMVN